MTLKAVLSLTAAVLLAGCNTPGGGDGEDGKNGDAWPYPGWEETV